MIERLIGTADFASRQSGQFFSLNSTELSTVSLAICRKNSNQVRLEGHLDFESIFRGEPKPSKQCFGPLGILDVPFSN